MNVFGKTFGLLLGLALMAALAAAAWLALEYVGSIFASLDAQVARVTAIGAAIAILAAMIVAAAIRDAGRRAKAAQVRAEKESVYRLFVDCWGDAAADKLQSLDRLLALHGSAAVIKAHLALREIAREKGPRHADAVAQLGKALIEIRKDLGGDAEALAIGAAELGQLVLAAPAAAHGSSGR